MIYYNMNTPLILTGTGSEQTAAEYTNDMIKSGIVLGGPGLISDEIVRTVFQMNASDEIKVK